MILRLILLFVIALLNLSCAGPSKKAPQPAPPQLKSELSRAEIDFQSGAQTKALARLEKIVAQHKDSDAADDAYILMGAIYYKQKKYTESYRAYIAVIDSEFFSPREVEAALGAAQSLELLGRFDEALALTGRALKFDGTSPETLIEIYSLRYRLQNQLGDRLDAARSLIYMASNHKDDIQKEKARIRALEFVESRLQDNELDTIARDNKFGFLRPYAMSRLAFIYFEQRDYSRAEKYFRGVVSTATRDSDLAEKASRYIEQIEARRRVAPYTIGAVLPLTGQHAARAQETLRGLELGLGIRAGSGGTSNFKIAVFDSESNPDVARRSVEKLVIEDSVIAVVGDILSRTAESVAHKADELGVPVITLSQKHGLTYIGDSVFQNAMTSKAIVSELVGSAINQYGMKKFGILYPNNGYGVEYANVFWDEVLARGGQVVAVQTYSPDERDFGGAISRLVGTYYLEDRADEYTARVKDWYSKQRTITSRVTPPRDLLPPIVDFDALFIPDGVRALSQIASMLKYNDIDKTRLLGTNIWNVPALLGRGTNLIEGALFVDSKVAVDPRFKQTPFYIEYTKIYREVPTQFQAQAYDVGVALRHLIERSGARTRTALRDRLRSLSGVPGSIDDIHVDSEHAFSRPLSVLTVQDAKIELATGAPEATAK